MALAEAAIAPHVRAFKMAFEYFKKHYSFIFYLHLPVWKNDRTIINDHSENIPRKDIAVSNQLSPDLCTLDTMFYLEKLNNNYVCLNNNTQFDAYA